MPNCQSCGRNVPDAEYNTPPAGYCRVCRRTAQMQVGMPRPCGRCGRAVPSDEWRRNQGYCDGCYAEEQAADVGTPTVFVVICPECGNPVDLKTSRTCHVCQYRIQPRRCPNPSCHQWMDTNARECPHCHWRNPGFVDTRVRTTKTMQKRINAKIYETAIFEIIGAFLFFGMPFLGLPSMPFLAVAIMALLPFYNFLPSESELLSSRQRNVESLGGEATTYLVLKSATKLLMFFFAVYDFYRLPISKLIPFIISWIYYFKLPVSYKTTEPFKMLEAWLRPFAVGPLLAFFIYTAFYTGGASAQATSLALMSVAFFCTSFPRHRNPEESDQGQVRIGVISGSHAASRFLRGEEGMFQDQILNIFFLIFMTLALSYSGVGLSMSFSAAIFAAVFFISLLLIINVSINHVILLMIAATVIFGFVYGGFSGEMITTIFFAVWELSIIVGLAGGKESRPAIGILMIFMTLFVFSFTATGVMGTAVFGYWWPQIASTVETITEPLGPMWEQVQTGMGDAWLMLTNPMGYYDQLNKRSQSIKSVVKQGGTTKSIELTKTDLFTSVTGELEPRLDPMVGSFEIQNQGEFDSNSIKLKLWASWQDPKTISATNPVPPIEPIGSLKNFECSRPWTSNSGPGSTGTCSWGTTYPQEMRVVNFVFNKRDWSFVAGNVAGNLADCNDCGSANETYVYSGQTVKVNANITYDYNVNVSIPAEVIEEEKYRSLLIARSIVLVDLTSQYTGGPVKATLWSQKQPIRNNEVALFVASIVNEGSGSLNVIRSFSILIPQDLADSSGIEVVAQTFKQKAGTDVFDGCNDGLVADHPTRRKTIGGRNFWEIYCVHNESIAPREYRRVSFFITPKPVSDRKTSLLIGLANYEYIKTASTSIKVANAPWH